MLGSLETFDYLLMLRWSLGFKQFIRDQDYERMGEGDNWERRKMNCDAG